MGRDAFLTEIVGMVIIAVGGSLFQRWHSRTLDVKTSSAWAKTLQGSLRTTCPHAAAANTCAHAEWNVRQVELRG